MRLTALKLAGFKSFVDPTTLPLPTNLTAVVGPNGSGKSNLIDAVRWVLGESSAKALRGAESEDVIFNGAKSRKPAGRASVELVFDNADQKLQGEWGRYTEIAVRREGVRGEPSRYFINGQKCLKRDVVDLFLGTGLGGRNQYAILEQGTVARLVEAKPEELRRWLEEAAGISRYKDRRRETESRIRQTRDNLARLGDVQGEITKRLEVLARQAADAEKYNLGKREERRLRAELLLLRRRAVERESARQQDAIRAVEQALEAARKALAEGETARRAADAARAQAGEVFNAVQGEVYEAQAALSREEQSLAHAREMQTLHERELQSAENQTARLRERIAQESTQVETLAAGLHGVEADSVNAARQQTAALEALTTAEAGLAGEGERWADFERRAQAPMLEAERVRMRVQGLEKAVNSLEQRHQRLARENETLDDAPLQASLFEADEELARLERDIDTAQARLGALDQELQGLRDQRTANESALHEARHALENLRGRRASLETLQQAALKTDDAVLGRWLDARGWQHQPRLADVVRVEAGWEVAVEHVLSGLLQSQVLDAWQSSELPQTGPAGGASAVAAQATGSPAPMGTLARQVAGPDVVREWLSSIAAVDEVSELASAVAALAPGASAVTRSGVWQGRGWIRYPRTDAADSGVIARGQLLRETEAQNEALTARTRAMEEAQQALRQRVQTRETERRGVASRVDQVRDAHGRCLAERQAQAVRLDQTRQRAAALSDELQTVESEQREAVEALHGDRARREELERDVRALQAERDQLKTTLAHARTAERTARAARDAAVQASNAAQVKTARQASALEAARHGLTELGAQLENIEKRLAAARVRRSELEQPVRQHDQQAGVARSTLETANQRLRACRERIVTADTQAQGAQHALQSAERQRDTVMESRQQARLAFEGQRSRREGLEAQLAETGQDVETLAAELPADADSEAWEARLARVGRRIERLGAINLAAIPELDEARERASYLDGQRADLEQALATLEAAMTQLDRETRDMFKTTFEKVDERFRECCPKLFGGGEAGLERTDDDWLAAGVRVMVRPPGKRNTTIQLLSGGEKALSALALLFALFELNPAPFCLLDEVEAPLDDANVARFCALVRDMSENVQFIIITHNKVTMELAGHLHGVTMQEPGVSRLVSVDVREAERMVEPAAEVAEV